MPVQFNLKRDPTAGLVPAGIHRFVVEKVEERSGPQGPYLNLNLRVFPNGVRWNSIVFEVLSTSIESKFRVDQFFDSVGAPETGVASEAWFLDKTGWAKFDHKPNKEGILQSRVVQYLTPDAAENAKAKLGIDGAGPVAAQRSRSTVSAEAAPSPTRKSGGKKADVAEMVEDDTPF